MPPPPPPPELVEALIASLKHWTERLDEARADNNWPLVDHTRRNIAHARTLLVMACSDSPRRPR